MGGELWFPAKDVCDILGITNSRQVTSRLRDDERQHVPPLIVTTNDVAKFPNRGMTCISETGVYKLTILSRKPEAEAFQDWIAEAVLSAIRKNGMYVTGEQKVETEEDIMALSLRAMEGLQKKLEEKTEALGIMSERVADVARTVSHDAGQLA